MYMYNLSGISYSIDELRAKYNNDFITFVEKFSYPDNNSENAISVWVATSLPDMKIWISENWEQWTESEDKRFTNRLRYEASNILTYLTASGLTIEDIDIINNSNAVDIEAKPITKGIPMLPPDKERPNMPDEPDDPNNPDVSNNEDDEDCPCDCYEVKETKRFYLTKSCVANAEYCIPLKIKTKTTECVTKDNLMKYEFDCEEELEIVNKALNQLQGLGTLYGSETLCLTSKGFKEYYTKNGNRYGSKGKLIGEISYNELKRLNNNRLVPFDRPKHLSNYKIHNYVYITSDCKIWIIYLKPGKAAFCPINISDLTDEAQAFIYKYYGNYLENCKRAGHTGTTHNNRYCERWDRWRETHPDIQLLLLMEGQGATIGGDSNNKYNYRYYIDKDCNIWVVYQETICLLNDAEIDAVPGLRQKQLQYIKNGYCKKGTTNNDTSTTPDDTDICTNIEIGQDEFKKLRIIGVDYTQRYSFFIDEDCNVWVLALPVRRTEDAVYCKMKKSAYKKYPSLLEQLKRLRCYKEDDTSTIPDTDIGTDTGTSTTTGGKHELIIDGCPCDCYDIEKEETWYLTEVCTIEPCIPIDLELTRIECNPKDYDDIRELPCEEIQMAVQKLNEHNNFS